MKVFLSSQTWRPTRAAQLVVDRPKVRRLFWQRWRGPWKDRTPVDDQLSTELAPPLVAGALAFDLPDERKEKRLMRRREKLPDFLRPPSAAARLLSMLEMFSWDWLRQVSFSRCLLRNSSLVPLWRKLTAGNRRRRSRIQQIKSGNPSVQIRDSAASAHPWQPLHPLVNLNY